MSKEATMDGGPQFVIFTKCNQKCRATSCSIAPNESGKLTGIISLPPTNTNFASLIGLYDRNGCGEIPIGDIELPFRGGKTAVYKNCILNKLTIFCHAGDRIELLIDVDAESREDIEKEDTKQFTPERILTWIDIKLDGTPEMIDEIEINMDSRGIAWRVGVPMMMSFGAQYLQDQRLINVGKVEIAGVKF